MGDHTAETQGVLGTMLEHDTSEQQDLTLWRSAQRVLEPAVQALISFH